MKAILLDTGTRPRLIMDHYEVVHIPLLRIQASSLVDEPKGHFDGVILSSPQTFEFAPWLVNFAAHKLCICVGQGTAQRSLDHGIPVHHMGEGTAEKTLQMMVSLGLVGRFLHPCSSETRLQPKQTAQHGIEIVNYPVYSPKLNPNFERECLQSLDLLTRLFGICYFSGSAVLACKSLSTKLSFLDQCVHFACGQSAQQALSLTTWSSTVLCSSQGPSRDWVRGGFA